MADAPVGGLRPAKDDRHSGRWLTQGVVSTREHHCHPFGDVVFHVRLWSFICRAITLLNVSLCRPCHLLPSGVQRIAALTSVPADIRLRYPSHLNRLFVIFMVCLCCSSMMMMFGHNIPSIMAEGVL